MVGHHCFSSYVAIIVIFSTISIVVRSQLIGGHIEDLIDGLGDIDVDGHHHHHHDGGGYFEDDDEGGAEEENGHHDWHHRDDHDDHGTEMFQGNVIGMVTSKSARG